LPRKPVIAVTAGDPAGVGPEIVARLLAEFRPADSRAVVVGASAAFAGYDLEGPTVPTIEDLPEFLTGCEAPVVFLDTGVTAPFPVGCDSSGGGEHAGRAIETACKLVIDGHIAAIVTAPISKKSLNLCNFPFPGHTEMLARYLNAPLCQMMMVRNGLRVIPLTRHVPLSEVSALISEQSIINCVTETARGLRESFGIKSPKIALAGLNPHAGDDGVIGAEDRDIIAPAIAALNQRAIRVDGPVPGDAMFQSVFRDIEEKGRPHYDAYVTMYHDQGLIPFKMLAQRRGVNVTIGLPVIRTSVDHGVAYDIAGQGIAETESLFEAYKLAEELSEVTTHE